MERYLQPIWDTKIIYDETGVIIGEEGEIRFLFAPVIGSVCVRIYAQVILQTLLGDYM